MFEERERGCPECEGITRRGFLKTVGGAAAALAAFPRAAALAAVAAGAPLPIAGSVRPARAATTGKPETLVKTLYDSLSEAQRKSVAFPWDHKLRQHVDANWAIVRPSISEFFTSDQKAMIRDIFRGLHSEEYFPRVMEHMDQDGGGLENYHVALFGTPGSGKFEWVLTGRHCTVRCDGDSEEGAAFGGPIFYGHAAKSFNEAADHPGNVYWYQAKRANTVFQALDGKQREKALLSAEAPPEEANGTVRLRGTGAELPGLPVGSMSKDQKKLVRDVMSDLLRPYRRTDADECLKLIDAAGGLDNVSMAFYRQGDIGDDGVWDIWRLEGPSMVWYLRGSPHVHTWAHIRRPGSVG